MKQHKMPPAERRRYILNLLKNSHEPLTGKSIAEKSGVSRQVIVQDISILKAKDYPIMASSQGYFYMNHKPNTIRHMIAVHHTPEETEKELYILVDHGITVKNVIVEHPIYGELTASLMVSNRSEVDHFLQTVHDTKASYLSELTEGVHLHTLEADSMNKINLACQKLKEANILLDR